MNYSILQKPLIPRRMKENLRGILFITVIVLVILLQINSMFINIRQGEAGVLWKRFGGGTQTDKIYKEGLHIINPFDRMTAYEITEQQHDFNINFLTKNGLNVLVRVSIRFTPLENKLAQIHKFVGSDYLDRLIVPEIGASMRRIFGVYDANEIYRSHGSIIKKVKSETFGNTLAQYFKLVDLIVLEFEFPEATQKMINEKIRKP